MREKLLFKKDNYFCSGITPACAGKTKKTLDAIADGGDHPRVCGKNRLTPKRSMIPWGSPPRVREKRNSEMVFKSYSGITPACAGKTATVKSSSKFSEDHPRVCGKNYAKIYDAVDGTGSPPRVREKLNQWVKAYQDFGITPACAGKTTRLICGKSNYRDHPRVCGKNS